MSTVVLEKDGLELTLCPPDLQEGYYRGCMPASEQYAR